MEKPPEAELETLTRKANEDLQNALEVLRDDLLDLDRHVQQAYSACRSALMGSEFKLHATGFVQEQGARIDRSYAEIHELAQRRAQLKKLVEQG